MLKSRQKKVRRKRMNKEEYSKNFEKIKKYYDAGFWKKSQVKNAVIKEKITAEEYEEITGEKYEC